MVIGCSLRDPDVQIALRTAIEDDSRLRVLVIDPAVNHTEIATRIHVSPDVIAVLQRPFAAEDATMVEQGTSVFMGMIRGYLGSTLGRLDIDGPYVFGVTHEMAEVPGGFPRT